MSKSVSFCVELIASSFLDLIFKRARLNAAVSCFLLNINYEYQLQLSFFSSRLFHENNTQATSLEIVTITWIDSSVAAKPLMCRIKEAMSRLAYLSFVIGFGKFCYLVQVITNLLIRDCLHNINV